MAGFVLVPLAAALVVTILLVIERGSPRRFGPHLDVTGQFRLAAFEDAEDPAFAPKPWSELQGYAEEAHPEVPNWAWVDEDAEFSKYRHTDSQWWAASLDDRAGSSADRDERWAALEEVRDEFRRIVNEAPLCSVTPGTAATAAYEAWLERFTEVQDRIAAARAGWLWAHDKVAAALAAR